MTTAARRGAGRAPCGPGRRSGGVSADGDVLVPAERLAEIRAQIESFPPLTPRQPRHSPIAGLVLTNGDLDHCLGLLSLRESHPLTVYATESVRAGFTRGNVLYRTLERFEGQVTWRALALDGDGAGRSAARGSRSDSADDHRDRHAREVAAASGETTCAPSPEDNVGLVIHDPRTGGRLAYFSGVAGPAPAIARALADADVLFFDGTFWSSDELIAAGLGTRRAEEMAHWPLGGPEGSRVFSAPARAEDPAFTSTTPTRFCARRAPNGGRSTPPGSRSPPTVWSCRCEPGRRADVARPIAASELLTPDELVARLRAEGVRRYHDQHPFHQRMHEGKLSRAELQAWTLNRYYYQTRIPIKDAIIVSKSEDPAFRRAWIRRIHDHDGDGPDDGGPRAVAAAGRGGGARSAKRWRAAAASCPACASPAIPTSRSAARARWWWRSPRR